VLPRYEPGIKPTRDLLLLGWVWLEPLVCLTILLASIPFS